MHESNLLVSFFSSYPTFFVCLFCIASFLFLFLSYWFNQDAAHSDFPLLIRRVYYLYIFVAIMVITSFSAPLMRCRGFYYKFCTIYQLLPRPTRTLFPQDYPLIPCPSSLFPPLFPSPSPEISLWELSPLFSPHHLGFAKSLFFIRISEMMFSTSLWEWQ